MPYQIDNWTDDGDAINVTRVAVVDGKGTVQARHQLTTAIRIPKTGNRGAVISQLRQQLQGVGQDRGKPNAVETIEGELNGE
jgi:hypothetical protein